MKPTMEPVSFLLVDDLEENLLSLEALLRRDDLNVLKARSGNEALELLLINDDVALALIDVQMPGLDGFQLAELMRGNERTRRIPIIFVTAASADRQRRFRGYEAGAVDFIYKPIEPDILKSKADVFFELARQRQQIALQRDELRVHAEALKEADRRKDIFLATLAHELRNPLAPIRNGIDLLRRNPEGESASDIRDMLDRQLAHLVRLIDDLLDVSRVSQGKIELRKEQIDVADVVRTAVESSRPLIDSEKHSLGIDIPTHPVWIDGDLTRLAQVIANLLNNAAKYTPAGGHVQLSVQDNDETATITVADNGIGIAADMQLKVFDLFTQADNHKGRAQGGLGIGLALVKQLVIMHGGTVEARSMGVDKGSSFTVSIPLANGSVVRPVETSAVSQRISTTALKVLVVDDNIELAQTVGWLLEEIGHSYELVHDGREAFQAAIKFGPDAILLDIGLPGMDGYAVCRELRGDDRFKKIPIIAQTGWGQERDKALASAAGFDFHLVKPVAVDDLERVLANAISEFRS
jgi:signal transduction histidine kinase